MQKYHLLSPVICVYVKTLGYASENINTRINGVFSDILEPYQDSNFEHSK